MPDIFDLEARCDAMADQNMRQAKRIAELERQLAEAKKALGQMRVICENREMSTLAKAGEMFRISLEGLKAIDAARKERG